MRMADILHRLGYIQRNHVVAVTRDDLVGQYVGHTAPKTKEVLKRAYGGVLFIDEAYYLYRPENERDYGVEAVEILLQVMENDRDKLVVILAGYKNRMDDFFRLNPGMSSRVAHHIDFPDYTVGELLRIGELMLAAQAYELSPDARRGASGSTSSGGCSNPGSPTPVAFATGSNARACGTPIGSTRRHETGSPTTLDDLVRIEPADILASRVFAAVTEED